MCKRVMLPFMQAVLYICYIILSSISFDNRGISKWFLSYFEKYMLQITTTIHRHMLSNLLYITESHCIIARNMRSNKQLRFMCFL